MKKLGWAFLSICAVIGIWLFVRFLIRSAHHGISAPVPGITFIMATGELDWFPASENPMVFRLSNVTITLTGRDLLWYLIRPGSGALCSRPTIKWSLYLLRVSCFVQSGGGCSHDQDSDPDNRAIVLRLWFAKTFSRGLRAGRFLGQGSKYDYRPDTE